MLGDINPLKQGVFGHKALEQRTDYIKLDYIKANLFKICKIRLFGFLIQDKTFQFSYAR